MATTKKKKQAVLRIELDAETTERLDRVRFAAIGEVSRTKAATHIIKTALADKK